MGRLANPGPLGLAGFGMTTILLNVCNAGFVPLNSSVLAMGLAFGGFAQMCAGLLEYPKGNTFGLTAFTSYGAFWISLVLLIFLPKFGLVAPATPRCDGSLSRYVGHFHGFHVCWHTESKSRSAVHLWLTDCAVRPAGRR